MRPSRSHRALGAPAAVLLALVFFTAAPLAGQSRVSAIASEFICLCGCGKILNVCEMDTAAQMKSIIAAKLDEGWGKKQIMAYMTETYGEKVLAAPTKRGFNLTAWVTPFAVLFAGAALIWLVIGAWVQARAGSRVEELGLAATRELESRYGAILDRELGEVED
jgi:cytochrome c-type biogenesis protein CcmH